MNVVLCPLLKVTQKAWDHSVSIWFFCLERIEEGNALILDNPALLTNFVNRLPEKFIIQYIQRALDLENTRSFDDLMKFLACCLRAVEHDPDEKTDTVSSLKKDNTTNVHGRIVNNNNVPGVSTNLAVTAVLTP